MSDSTEPLIIPLAGLQLTIYGVSNLPPPTTPPSAVTFLFLLHGRSNTSAYFHPLAERLSSIKGPLITILFDQRNHGHRLLSEKQNNSWKQGNPEHATDLFSMYWGTSRDVSEIIDILPALLFQEGEYTVAHNIVTGVSLGGHSTWLTLLHEPRVEAGCVIIGCADFVKLMERRASRTPLEGFKTGACKAFPKSLLDVVERVDPTRVKKTKGPEEVARLLQGKTVLTLSGGVDKVVPYVCQENFIRWLEGVEGVEIVDKVYKDIGHRFDTPMEEDFLSWLQGLLQKWH